MSGVPAQGESLYQLHCAACHGPTGEGGYLGKDARIPAVAGAEVAAMGRLRPGGGHLPTFTPALIPDDGLTDLGSYVHEGLAHPAARPEAPLPGPHALSPMQVGLIVWAATILFALLIGQLFRARRN